MPGRARPQRREDAIHRLETDLNVWVATSSADAQPHLVPLSLTWDGTRIILATPTDTLTVKNLAANGSARLALDSTVDVVIIDAAAEVLDLSAADGAMVHGYVERVGWDPRLERGEWSLLVLAPTRIQAWQSVGEIERRTLMLDGVWT
jgi:Pyridoxamine 5'-phosphate oxidase